MSRTNDRFAEAGVSPSALAKRSASMPNTIAVSSCPTSFEVLFRPRLRWLRILM